MVLQNVNDIDALFQKIKQCKGTVELVSKEGDRLNMKSKLTEMLIIAKAFTHDTIKEMELVCHEPEDVAMMVDFMVNGK